MTPAEQCRVSTLFYEFSLQPLERVTPLPVQRRHVDVKQPKQAVRLVFDPSRLALRRPGHTHGDRCVDSEVPLPSKVFYVDSCALRERKAEVVLCA